MSLHIHSTRTPTRTTKIASKNCWFLVLVLSAGVTRALIALPWSAFLAISRFRGGRDTVRDTATAGYS